LIAAAFSNIVATTLANAHTVPLAIVVLGLAGVVVGFLIYRGRVHLAVVTVVGLALFYGALFLGKHVPMAFGTDYQNWLVWVVFALVFSFFGSVLPIWSFVQPINYLSFFIILVGMAAAVLGIFVKHPAVARPAFIGFTVDSLPLWPMLFVTIACGAISGWHGIVSSTGTSRQLESELDARPVSAGAMFLEMILALIALVIVAITPLAAAVNAEGKPLGEAQIFGNGLGTVFHYLRLPESWGQVYGPVMIVILAITILHLVVRFMRIATNELLGRSVPILRVPSIGTLLALILTFVLVATGTFKYIWVLFGSANQLMASLALMIASIWLLSEKKNPTFSAVPMVFMYLTTMGAIVVTCVQLFQQAAMGHDLKGKALTASSIAGSWIAGIIGVVLFGAALILAYDGVKAFLRYWRVRKQAAGAADPAQTERN